MNIHEYGTENRNVLVLIHPSLVMWDYFEYVIPLLSPFFHLVIPALPGYDPDSSGDFTSVEQIASELADWLIAHGHSEVCGVYGCSMGGSIVIRMLTDSRLRIRSAMIDGGIRLLQKAFSADEYSGDDLQYIAGVLRMISAKTVWRTFESCNNYPMPDPVRTSCRNIEYWLADAEIKARKLDITYIRQHFPDARFRRFRNLGHGGLAVLQPDKFVKSVRFVTGRPEI